MSSETTYLSHGMGVNSTALMLLMLDEGRACESVFVNHGCDYPETYNYLEHLQNEGYKITVLKPDVIAKVVRYDNLYDYFWHYKSIPLIHYRICTDKFKIKPVLKYIQTPCKVYLGYDAGEKRRVYKPKTRVRRGVTYEYPLMEKQVARSQCIEIIREHGLRIPPKSGCWFCPFQSRRQWKKLMVNHPDLFRKAIELEERALLYRGKVGLLCDGKKRLSGLWQDNKITQYLPLAYLSGKYAESEVFG